MDTTESLVVERTDALRGIPIASFPEPRDIIPLPAEVLDVFATRHHRLHHMVWHSVRQMWSSQSVSDAGRARIAELGWKPPRVATEFTAKGDSKRPLITNGSGEDFLFMHREMIAQFRALMRQAGQDPFVQWNIPPEPGVALETGFAVPPAWGEGSVFARRIGALKGDEYYWGRMRWWDREFKDPTRLRELSLGELGSLLEFGIHNDMHMRWSSTPRDAQGNPGARDDWDIDPRWDDPKYDWLGEFYSSHVNPVFWRLHGWVDDRIDDWFAAHQEAHPGEVEQVELNGVRWFSPGRWVKASDPWSGPAHGGHSSHGDHGDHGDHGHAGHGDPMEEQIRAMEEVVRILFPVPPQANLAADVAFDGAAAPAEPSHHSWFGTGL